MVRISGLNLLVFIRGLVGLAVVGLSGCGEKAAREGTAPGMSYEMPPDASMPRWRVLQRRARGTRRARPSGPAPRFQGPPPKSRRRLMQVASRLDRPRRSRTQARNDKSRPAASRTRRSPTIRFTRRPTSRSRRFRSTSIPPAIRTSGGFSRRTCCRRATPFESRKC